jgi:rubredoxin
MALVRQSAKDIATKSESVVRCPKCGFEKLERMPADFCLIRYECSNCGFIMTTKKGDCCIFCSYGSVPCQPEQIRRGNS